MDPGDAARGRCARAGIRGPAPRRAGRGRCARQRDPARRCGDHRGWPSVRARSTGRTLRQPKQTPADEPVASAAGPSRLLRSSRLAAVRARRRARHCCRRSEAAPPTPRDEVGPLAEPLTTHRQGRRRRPSSLAVKRCLEIEPERRASGARRCRPRSGCAGRSPERSRRSRPRSVPRRLASAGCGGPAG